MSAAAPVKGFQIPPRSTWTTLASAGNSIVSLFDSKTRDNFIEVVDKGIINPPAFGQLNLGLAMVLALHHDLYADTSLLKRYKFDAEDFLDGAGHAVESFQETLYSVDRTVLSEIEDAIFKANEAAKTATEDEENKDEEEENAFKIAGDDEANQELNKRSKLIHEIFEKQLDWKDTIEQDPECLQADLANMVSKPLLEAVEMQFMASVIHNYIMNDFRMDYEENSGEVSNVVLLSARAQEIIPEGKEDDNDDDSELTNDSPPMEDDSFSSGIEREYPVIAQVEVMYSLSQNFQQKMIGNKDKEGEISDGNNNEDKETDDEHESSTTTESQWVAVFEGSMNGPSPCRWKLVDNKPFWMI